jgi:hypothetical protein
MIPHANILHFHAEGFEPVYTEIPPVFEPFQIRSRFAEEFQLHLLKLSCSEREIAGSYLVAEGFAYLGDSERYLFSRRSGYISEIDKDALSRFRSQKQFRLRIFSDSLKGFEHEVELAD